MASEDSAMTRALRALYERQRKLRGKRQGVALQESIMAQKVDALDEELRRIEDDLRQLSL